MNLLHEFEKALSLEEYLPLLGDQKTLHDLHYKRVDLSETHCPEKVPPLKILVLTEPWCGDSTAILPVLLKFFENKQAEFRIALRDENPELMEKFLTNGGKAIPIVLVLNQKGDFLMRFGPRPQAAQQIFEAYREDINQGKIERMAVMKKIRSFYSKDRGKTILSEFCQQLSQVI